MARKKNKKQEFEPGINDKKYRLIMENGFRRLDNFLKTFSNEIENDYNVSETMAVSIAYEVFIKYVGSLIAVSVKDEEDLKQKLTNMQALISTEYFKYQKYIQKHNNKEEEK